MPVTCVLGLVRGLGTSGGAVQFNPWVGFPESDQVGVGGKIRASPQFSLCGADYWNKP